MKTKIVISALFLLISEGISGQTTGNPILHGYLQTSAYSQLHKDVFSFTGNQASLAGVEKAAVGVFAERRFLLAELSHYIAVFSLPTASGNFGFKGGYYGASAYNETRAGLAYARRLGPRIDLGIQFNYNSVRMAGYGTASVLSVEAGSLFHLTQKLHMGVQINNPAGGKFGSQSMEKLPFVYKAGFGYDASGKFFLSMEIIKEEVKPVDILAGIQYKLVSQLSVRGGVSTATAFAWFGFGFLLKSFRLDMAAGFHPQTGITPGMLLLFNLPSAGQRE